MRRSSLLLLTFAITLTGGAWLARTQAPQQSAQLTLEKVKDNLYVIIGDGGNVAVYVTGDGVILVDDKFDRNYTDIMAKVKSVTPQPVKYILNTHQHGDHTGSNEKLLSQNVEIIAQKNARANMAAAKMPGVPRLSFTDETEVFLGGKEVRTRYFGRGHTNGDAMVYFPELKVVHTGDLLVDGMAPFIDYTAGGSALDWTGTIDNALKSGWDFETVIPGHGKVTNRAGLVDFRTRFENMRNKVAGMVRDNKSTDEIGKTLISEFGWQTTRPPDGIIAELKK